MSRLKPFIMVAVIALLMGLMPIGAGAAPMMFLQAGPTTEEVAPTDPPADTSNQEQQTESSNVSDQSQDQSIQQQGEPPAPPPDESQVQSPPADTSNQEQQTESTVDEQPSESIDADTSNEDQSEQVDQSQEEQNAPPPDESQVQDPPADTSNQEQQPVSETNVEQQPQSMQIQSVSEATTANATVSVSFECSGTAVATISEGGWNSATVAAYATGDGGFYADATTQTYTGPGVYTFSFNLPADGVFTVNVNNEKALAASISGTATTPDCGGSEEPGNGETPGQGEVTNATVSVSFECSGTAVATISEGGWNSATVAAYATGDGGFYADATTQTYTGPGVYTFSFNLPDGSFFTVNVNNEKAMAAGISGTATTPDCSAGEEPGGEDQPISAKALTDHECDSSEWHFVITQVESEDQAPASIQVTWANSASETVWLNKVTGGVAHYATTSNLDSTVTSASAEIYSGWEGQFNLSHGPCGDTGTPTETPTGTPTGTPTETPTSTPSETPTGTPTTPVETPTSTPDEGTPSPTPDNGTPSVTPTTPAGTPTTPVETPTVGTTPTPGHTHETPVPPTTGDDQPPSATGPGTVNQMPDTGSGDTSSSNAPAPISPWLPASMAVLLTFIAWVNLKWDLPAMVAQKIRR